MSWHISQSMERVYVNSRCSQEQAAAFSAASYSDGEPSVPLKSTITADAYSWPDKMTDASNHSQSGTMSEPSTGDHGAELLTWFLAGFPVRTSQPQEEAQGSRESGPDSGKSSHGSFAKFDPASYSWRTHQFSLAGGLESFSETWPRWGTMHAGECYPLPMPSGLVELRAWITSASESGLSLPSPKASDATRGDCPSERARRSPFLGSMVKRLPTTRTASQSGGGIGLDGGTGSREMIAEALGDQAAKDLTGGSLNPEWVEWFMGWPIGWTDSQPLETAKFRQWQHSHGQSFCLNNVSTSET